MSTRTRPHTTTSDAHPEPPGRDRQDAAVRWWRDLGLGVRLVLGGGRSARTRMALTAVGVGLGVGLLLLAASVPNILASRSARTDARAFVSSTDRTAHSVLMADVGTEFRDIPVSGLLIQSESAHPVVPPGLTRVPEPGELAASPKLRELLTSPDGALLRQRIGYRHLTGTITDDGLSGPNEYWYYLGSDQLAGRSSAFHVVRFGEHRERPPLDPALLLLMVVGVSVLLMPVAVFIGSAVRFGAESRDRQQAALRLVGADKRMTRRIAAGEALVGAVLGLAVGAVVFLIGRQLVERVTILRVSVFAHDVRPDGLLAAFIVLALPAAAVAVTMVALRRVVVEPLGVVRRAAGRRRRLWWRLLVPVAGVAMLLPLSGGMAGQGRLTSEVEIAAGVVLLLGGMTLLLPWIVEAAVRRIGGGGVAWQLATRRLQLDSGSAARVVGGITVAVAGAIALQTLFTGLQHTYVQPSHQDPHRAQMMVDSAFDLTPGARARAAARYRSTPGVRSVVSYTHAVLDLPHDAASAHPLELVIGSCATLRELAQLGECADGDAFVVPGAAAGRLRPGVAATIGGLGPRGDRERRWQVPGHLTRAATRRAPDGTRAAGVLMTPAAARRGGPSVALPARFYVRTDPARDDAYDQVRTTAARQDPLTRVLVLEGTHIDTTFGVLRRGLFAGATAVLLLIGASMLVNTVEQLRERQRPLAVLAAFGGRRRTLSISVLWQATIPMTFGLLLALVVGTALGEVLLRIVHEPPWFDWAGTAAIVGVGGAVVLLVTALSMPALWRLMRPEGMRTE